MTWQEAEPVLNSETIIVIPLGSAAKEHGPHLPLNNDWLTAQFLKQELLLRSEIVVVPTVSYFYYPAFVEYPGSITLSLETSAAMISEICTSLAKFGPRKFYVLNNGISTAKALAMAQENLAQRGLLLSFTDLHEAYAQLPADLGEQEGGSHADELETSLMLAISPQTVNMDLACKDYHDNATGRLTRDRDAGLSYSPSGVWGDARLASKEKGIKIVECLVDYLLKDIERLRLTPPRV